MGPPKYRMHVKCKEKELNTVVSESKILTMLNQKRYGDYLKLTFL